ncbi:hypothetical protein ACSQ67_007774 [Phaseolus vulgaris]
MAMNHAGCIRYITTKEAVRVACQRTFATGANILKEGTDPKILPDSDYPDWLWHLLDKRPALSELRRKNVETLSYDNLKHFVKLDNRARIKENNSMKAKN